MKAELSEPASANLTSSTSVAGMAEREGWTPEAYALALSRAIRDDKVPLDMQRERLQALASQATGLAANQAAANELGQHYIVLTALFERLAHAAAKASTEQRGANGATATERLTTGAIKCQRAALATLSAMKVLRDDGALSQTGGDLALP